MLKLTSNLGVILCFKYLKQRNWNISLLLVEILVDQGASKRKMNCARTQAMLISLFERYAAAS